MKTLLPNTSKKNLWLIIGIGIFCFLLYTLFLCFRPQKSWCDDAFWADWARQLAVHNRYYTTVWGFGHPSYCPLYVFIMALWYKIVGFSFFTAQFPNIIFTLITYLILSLILTERKKLNSTQGIICFSTLFWLSPSMFQIYNCGRIEVLCLLLGILTSYNFIRAIETHDLSHRILLFIFSLLLFATGVEGVVFATLSIVVYSVFYYKEAWSYKLIYVWHFGGYITSLGCLSVITWYTHCLHQFYDTMFGFSKTLSSFYFYIRALVKGIKQNEITIDNMSQIPTSNATKGSFIQSLLDGIFLNKEYLVLVISLFFLFCVLCYVVKWKKIHKSTIMMTTLAIITPIVYVLAGRYVSYYTWTAYIPTIIAIVLVIEQLGYKWLPIGMTAFLSMLFFSPYNHLLYEFDLTHQRDKQNIADIRQAQINPSIPTVIPYQWYYYVVNSNENIYFQGSGAYPEDLSVIIYSPKDYNEEQFMNRYELKERTTIGDKIIFDIISLKNKEHN